MPRLLFGNASTHPFRGNVQRPPNVAQLGLGQIVIVPKSVVEVLTACRILDSEPYFLEGHSAVVIFADYLDRGLLKGAEQTSLSARLIVRALSIIIAVPNLIVL